MKKLLAATILSSAFAFPAFAMSNDTSCADFSAMDTNAQTQALSAMQKDQTGNAVKSEGSTSTDSTTGDTSASSSTANDTTAGTASGTTSDGSSTSGMSSDTMASGSMNMSAEDVAKACAANPDMTVRDAMKKAGNK